MSNIDVTDQANKNPIAGSPDWRQAATDLINYWIGRDRPFSSGEVAAALRIHRQDFWFSVPKLGEHVRDLFYSNAMPHYPDDGQGNPVYPSMTPRITAGKFPLRTPAGVEVLVYGPAQAACDGHEFEVFIPNPGETMADAPAPAQVAPAPAAGSPAAVQILGARIAAVDVRAKVFEDGRLCVPRTAFEMCVHLGGTPLRGGDPVYVKVEADQATITLTQDDPAAKTYDLGLERGRVLFPSPDAAKPFKAGDVYAVQIDKGKITVDLTKTV